MVALFNLLFAHVVLEHTVILLLRLLNIIIEKMDYVKNCSLITGTSASPLLL